MKGFRISPPEALIIGLKGTEKCPVMFFFFVPISSVSEQNLKKNNKLNTVRLQLENMRHLRVCVMQRLT